MSSQHAMEKHYGKMNTYRSSEGRKIEIKYKGKLADTVKSRTQYFFTCRKVPSGRPHFPCMESRGMISQLAPLRTRTAWVGDVLWRKK